MVAVKAICEPSGEKYGSISSDGVDVKRRAVPPLRDTTHKSPAYSKAIESRLTVGWRSNRVPCALASAEMLKNRRKRRIGFMEFRPNNRSYRTYRTYTNRAI